MGSFKSRSRIQSYKKRNEQNFYFKYQFFQRELNLIPYSYLDINHHIQGLCHPGLHLLHCVYDFMLLIYGFSLYIFCEDTHQTTKLITALRYQANNVLIDIQTMFVSIISLIIRTIHTGLNSYRNIHSIQYENQKNELFPYDPFGTRHLFKRIYKDSYEPEMYALALRKKYDDLQHQYALKFS